MKRKKMMMLAVVLCFMFSMSIVGPAVAKPSGKKVFTVEPSGDMTGITDTANIQQALDDAIATGKKSTVLLEAGDFYICETIVAINFDGTFKGAGAGVTIIHSVENFPADSLLMYPRLMVFRQDRDSTSTAENPYEIQLCDFTIYIDQPTEEWYAYGWMFRSIDPIEIYGKPRDVNSEDVSYYDARCKNVEFIGDIGAVYGDFSMSIQNALYIQGHYNFEPYFYLEKITGNYLVEGCTFENCLFTSIFPGQLVDSRVRIVRNSYENVLDGPEIYDLVDSHVEVAFNEITGAALFGVYVANGMFSASLDPGRVTIHHNEIECAPGGTGIWIDDFVAASGELDGVSVFAHHNKITMNHPYCMGIVGFGAQNTWLLRNTISGAGMAGIVTGVGMMFYGMQDDVGGWKILLNDLSDFTADLAAIWLGPGTHDFWVLHRGPSSSVLDEGADNHLMFLWW